MKIFHIFHLYAFYVSSLKFKKKLKFKIKSIKFFLICSSSFFEVFGRSKVELVLIYGSELFEIILYFQWV